MSEQPRCVWLTDADMATPLDSAFRELVRSKRDAAPADPAAAVLGAVAAGQDPAPIERDIADDVLRALGWDAS